MSELVRAILRDEPLKMPPPGGHLPRGRGLHPQHVGAPQPPGQGDFPRDVLPLVLEALSHACGALVADAYEGDVVAFMDWLPEAAGAETMAEALCAQMAQAGLDGVLVTCQDLTTTADVRRAYLAIRKALPDALRIWPGRGRYTLREMEFAQTCRETVAAGEAAVQRALAPLEPVRALREGAELVHTLQLYLLDTDRSVTQTAQALLSIRTPSNTGFSSSAPGWGTRWPSSRSLRALYRLRGGAPAGGLRLAGRAVSLSQGTMRQPCFSAWKPITFLL